MCFVCLIVYLFVVLSLVCFVFILRLLVYLFVCCCILFMFLFVSLVVCLFVALIVIEDLEYSRQSCAVVT